MADSPLAAIMLKAKPKDGDASPDGPDAGGDKDPLYYAADDLIQAVHSKDCDGVASALQNAFQIMQSQPDDGGDDSGPPPPGGQE